MEDNIKNNEFIIGCNYWSSDAGTDMWANWDENAVRGDLKILSELTKFFLSVGQCIFYLLLEKSQTEIYSFCLDAVLSGELC